MGTLFSAYDIRGKLGENISKEYVWLVGQAFAEWLPDTGSIVVATSAEANESITHAFIEGVLLQGRDVIHVGGGGQQAVLDGIADNTASGGVLISHDGIQNLETIALFDAQSTTIGAESGLSDISTLVDGGNFLPAVTKGNLINK